MNKQELHEKLTSNRDKCFEEANKYAVLSLDRQIVDSKALVYMQVTNWVEQLAEQPKVTVPQFVADWFEANKHRLETAIWDLTTDAYVTEPHQSSKIQLWLKVSDSPYETLIRMKDGYEIEKEPVYEVEFFRGGGERYLLMELGEKSYEVAPESENDGYHTQWFTESEIKSIDERYWTFAVPVEEGK